MGTPASWVTCIAIHVLAKGPGRDPVRALWRDAPVTWTAGSADCQRRRAAHAAAGRLVQRVKVPVTGSEPSSVSSVDEPLVTSWVPVRSGTLTDAPSTAR